MSETHEMSGHFRKLADEAGWTDSDILSDAMRAVAAELDRLDKWRLYVENLTPQGSEYHNDLEWCSRYIDRVFEDMHQAKKDRELQRRRITELEDERNDSLGRWGQVTEMANLITELEAIVAKLLEAYEGLKACPSIENPGGYYIALTHEQVLALRAAEAAAREGVGK